MKSLSRPRIVAAASLGLALLAFGSAARADVWFSVDAPVYSAPAPVYADPQPVYVDPQPVYVDPQPAYVDPQPAFVAPDPVYVAPSEPVYVAPAWQGDDWRQRGWEHHRHLRRDWDDGDDD